MRWKLAFAGFAVYFALAGWAKFSYVDPAPTGAVVFQLQKPFENVGGFSWRVAGRVPDGRLVHTEQALIFEDSTLLLAREASWHEISARGRGRYRTDGPLIVFSTSDGSDPNGNGRHYWAVVPK